MIQRRVLISGRVQGVGYRHAVLRTAGAYEGLRGFVRNLPDGRVEAVFSGNEYVVLNMVDWCREGPRFAEVTDVEVIEEAVDPSLSLFHVRR